MLRYCYNFRQSEHQCVNLLGNVGIAWINFGVNRVSVTISWRVLQRKQKVTLTLFTFNGRSFTTTTATNENPAAAGSVANAAELTLACDGSR